MLIHISSETLLHPPPPHALWAEVHVVSALKYVGRKKLCGGEQQLREVHFKVLSLWSFKFKPPPPFFLPVVLTQCLIM